METLTQIRGDDILRVVNLDDFAHTVKWNSRRYVLQPGKDTFIPGAAVFTWFGDPRATATYQSLVDEEGVPQFIADRKSEIRRLRIKYGAGIAGDEYSFDGVATPNVEVWTADGERVWTVLDDPDGDHVSPSPATAADENSMRALLAAQQRQIELLREQMDLRDDAAKAAASEAELPQDGAEAAFADAIEEGS